MKVKEKKRVREIEERKRGRQTNRVRDNQRDKKTNKKEIQTLTNNIKYEYS